MLNLKKHPWTQARRDWLSTVLANWKTTNAALPTCSMIDLRDMLVYELTSNRRMAILERLVTRYSKLESRANQEELQKAWNSAGNP
jgi:hypothetical protein